MHPAAAGGQRALFEGVACALGAGLLWGLVFVVPLMLPDYPPAMLSFGRYLGFGVIALLLAWADLPRLQRLQRAGLANGLRTGAGRQHPLLPLPLGGDPAGRRPAADDAHRHVCRSSSPWSPTSAAKPCRGAACCRRWLVMASGIALVNQHEMALLDEQGRSAHDYFIGGLLALAAVAAWTWYPVRNSRWLRQRPHLASGTWAIAQGLATLPLAAVRHGRRRFLLRR
jgi:drug/metabolite transporter (DMT)-like permease